MHPADHYVALRQWANASAFDAADEEGVRPPVCTKPLGSVVALRMATDLLWICVADAGDLLDEDAAEALALLESARGALLERIRDEGAAKAGHCKCGDYVGFTASGHLRECARCDYCTSCKLHFDDCDCDFDFDDTEDCDDE